jgi:hypothetical protein
LGWGSTAAVRVFMRSNIRTEVIFEQGLDSIWKYKNGLKSFSVRQKMSGKTS